MALVWLGRLPRAEILTRPLDFFYLKYLSQNYDEDNDDDNDIADDDGGGDGGDGGGGGGHL